MSTCLVTTTEAPAETIQRVAAGLVRKPVESIEPLGGGRNSRVFRIVDSEGRPYALKSYFRHHADRRDRLQNEFDGLRFLWRNGVRAIPQPLAADREAGWALYEFVEGRKASIVTAADVDAAIDFLGRLKALAGRPGSERLPAASEACFSGDELLGNLQFRLDRLLRGTGFPTRPERLQDGLENPSYRTRTLERFLRDQLVPAVQYITTRFRSQRLCRQLLPQSQRTLSPSDFGFHNALRRAGGQWVFVDFEYFGWDDPAKTLSDFLLHPAMALTDELKRQFAAGLLRHFAGDPSFAERVRHLYPLFCLKWCLILLNEFLPEHLLRRQFAAVDRRDQLTVQHEQLDKAQRMLERVRHEYEHFRYFD